jgi:thioester reductase-like protein
MTIFITGATGFLGSYLLKALLEQEQQPIIALVRTHEIAPIERIYRSLKACQASSSVLALASKFITCIQGDITQTHLGLSLLEFKTLAKKISSVWHIAGAIQLSETNPQILEATNLHGTKQILELLDNSPNAQFYHVSTAFVAGKRSGTIKEHELFHYVGFENPYEAYKYHAELLIHSWAKEQQRPVTIFRPSILITNIPDLPTYPMHPLTVLARAYQTVVSSTSNKIRPTQTPLRIPGDSSAYLNFVPVNYAVQAMLRAAYQSTSSHIQTYHVVNPVDVPIVSLIKVFSKISNIPINIHPEIPTDTSPLERKILRAIRIFLPYHFQKRHFNDAQMQSVLPPTINCPKITESYLLESLSKFCYSLDSIQVVS